MAEHAHFTGPFDPDVERTIRHDGEARLVYADWLEERGETDRAGALRRHRPPLRMPPVDLSIGSDPEDVEVHFYRERRVPLILLVVADFTQRPDPRPIDDRRERHVRRGELPKVMGEHKLRFEVDVALPGRSSVEVSIRQLEHFEPESVAAQLARTAKIQGADLDRAVAAVLRDPRLVEAERIWRSLDMLLEHAPEQTHIEIMNASKEDVLADQDDAPELEKAGLFRMVNYLNHSGMQPPGAVVFGWPLSPAADARVLRYLAAIGRARTIPMLVPVADVQGALASPETAGQAAFRANPDARFVALCAPSFMLRPARAGAPALAGPASFLVARLLAESFGRTWAGADVRRTLSNVELFRPLIASESVLASERGYLVFMSDPDGATLHDDATYAAREEPAGRSLSLLFLLTRIAQLAMNVHYRRGHDARLVTRDAGAVAKVLERGLITRLGEARGLAIELRDPRWIQEPVFWDDHGIEYGGTLDVEISIALPPSAGQAATRVSERVIVRLGF